MAHRAVSLLLLLLLLLPQHLTAQTPSSTPAAASYSDGRFDIHSIQAASAAGAEQLRLSRPAWLGPGITFPDDPSLHKSRPRPNSQSDATAARSKASAAAAAPLPRQYIVQLKTPSAAAVLGPSVMPAEAAAAAAADAASESATPFSITAVTDGTRSNGRSRVTPQAAAAASVVQAQAAAVAAAAGVSAQVTHTYSYALSGFAIKNPTSSQLAALAADDKVAAVTEDVLVYTATYSTPQFLGLTAKGGNSAGTWRSSRRRQTARDGVWNQLGGVEGYSGAGENVIIGVIDTGIWMDGHLCFADGSYWSGGNSLRQDYKQLWDWKGACSAQEQQACNSKVVGCRYYTAGWGGDAALLTRFPNEQLNCKDIDGHGSHTASTAAGNYGDTSDEAPAGALLSGVAPRARLAIYKVWELDRMQGKTLWGQGVGTSSDMVAAIEDAIKDGVDVINYSIGGGTATNFRAATMTAFMNAARAGVYVAVAAGNAGPAPSVEALSPWVTTVAASTHDRILEVTMVLGNDQQVTGTAPQVTSVGPLPLVYAADIAATGNRTDAALCAPNSLNASALTGPAIVACDRGVYLIMDKVKEVGRIGGRNALVLMNVPGGRTDQFFVDFGLPYVHVTSAQRDIVLQYVQSSRTAATATLNPAKAKLGQTAPAMAEFSSRGPIPTANAVVLKPDVTAPGVNVLAAYSNKHAYISGTSMSTPMIAGVAALIKDKYPNWSPMAIKSAIMTTAYQTTKTGSAGQLFGSPLDFGAGHVDPAKALDPGLVFDSSYTDWQRFLCDVEPFPGDDCAKLCSDSASSKPNAASTLADASATDASQQATALSATTTAAVVLEAGPTEQPPPPPPSAEAAEVVLAPYSEALPSDDVEPQHRKKPPRPGRPPSSPSPPAHPEPKPPSRRCDALNFNGPWISGEASVSLTVVRKVTSVLAPKEGWVTFTAEGLLDAGSAFEVVVLPASFKMKGGRSQEVVITVKARAGTPLRQYQFGQVIWRSTRGHSVRIPIAVKFNDFVAPSIVVPVQRSPSFQYRFKIGADASTTVNIKSLGMAAADVTELAVEQTTSTDLTAPGVGKAEITVPEGNAFFGAAIFNTDVPVGVDLDLYIFQGDTLIGFSNSDSSFELLEAADGLPVGTYTVYIYPASLPMESVKAYLHIWLLPAKAQGPMQVTPSSVEVQAGDMSCCPITLSFSGLDFASNMPKRYVGALEYSRADGKPASVSRTMVYVGW